MGWHAAGVAVAVLVSVLVAGSGVAGAHGNFSTTVVGTAETGVGVEESFLAVVSTGGADHDPALEAGPLNVTVTLAVDGDRVRTWQRSVALRSSLNLHFEYAFAETGSHTLTVETEYETEGWRRTESGSTVVTVQPATSDVALQRCVATVDAGVLPPYRFQCYPNHGEGLAAGLAAHPPLVPFGIASLLLGLLAGVRWL